MTISADRKHDAAIMKWQNEENIFPRVAHSQRHARRTELRYTQYVGTLEPQTMPDGEVLEFDEYLPCPDLTPEEALIEKQTVAETQARLTMRQQSILYALMDGRQVTELPQVVGLSQRHVYRELRAMGAYA